MIHLLTDVRHVEEERQITRQGRPSERKVLESGELAHLQGHRTTQSVEVQIEIGCDRRKLEKASQICLLFTHLLTCVIDGGNAAGSKGPRYRQLGARK